MNSKLTIAIPVCNRYDYFEEALSSATGQSSRCEVLVVDNASSHDRFELCCKLYKDRGASIRYVRNPSNLGLFGNWNRCAELSETEFTVILCDDDVLSLDYSRVFHAAYERNKELDYFYGRLGRFGEKYQGHPFEDINFGVFKGIDAIARAARSGLTWPTNSTAYRTAHLRRHPFRHVSLSRASNSDYLHVYTASTNSLVVGVDQVLYRFRQHEKQSGHIHLQYAILSRSLVFAEIAEILHAAGDPGWLRALHESAATVVGVAIVRGRSLRDELMDGRRDGDPYVNFVLDFWANNSSLISGLCCHRSRMEWMAAYARARCLRFSARMNPSWWAGALLPEPSVTLSACISFLKEFRRKTGDSGPVMPIVGVNG